MMNGNKCRDPQPVTGPRSGNSFDEKEDQLYKTGWGQGNPQKTSQYEAPFFDISQRFSGLFSSSPSSIS